MTEEFSAEPARTPKVGYLLGTYPTTSTTFVRREIEAMEAQGVPVVRYAMRHWDRELVDAGDRAERDRTRLVLGIGSSGLIRHLLGVAIRRPVQFLRSFRLAVDLGRRSERGLLIHLIYLAEACVVLDWFRRDGVDHVHVHLATNPTTVALLCRTLGGPGYSFTVHGPEEFDRPMNLRLDEKLRRASFAVAISEFTRSQLYRWTHFEDWPKIHVIRVGVSPLFLAHGPSPIRSAPRLVCVGRIVEQKGHAVLIQAAARLRDQGFHFRLSLVGDGPMRPQIEQMIETFQLQEHVEITGYQSNRGVLDEIIRSRALVAPSFAEGLPGVFFESLALGRPVITTYVAGHPELIEPGVNGWLVPAGAVEPLADAMAEALTASPERLSGMGQEGARRIARLHDASDAAAMLSRLMRDGVEWRSVRPTTG